MLALYIGILADKNAVVTFSTYSFNDEENEMKDCDEDVLQEESFWCFPRLSMRKHGGSALK